MLRRLVVASVVSLVAAALGPLGPPTPPVAAAPGDEPAVAFAAGDAGYLILDAAGGIFRFGDAEYRGSVPGLRAQGVAVGPVEPADVAAVPGGYLVLDRTGGVFAFGEARFHGSVPGLRAAGAAIPPIDAVAIAATPSGDGYVVLDRTGGVFAFGEAPFRGSIPSLRAGGNSIGHVVAVDVAVVAGGYLVLDHTGGVFAFGDAPFHGSVPALQAAGVVGGGIVATALAAVPGGYLVLDGTGGVFAFGDARFHGSIPGLRSQGVGVGPLEAIDLAATSTGAYRILDSTGGVFTFGGASFHGSIPQIRPTPAREPTLDVSRVVSGLTVPWDLDWAPDGTLVFTERPGRLSALVGGAVRVLAAPGDVYAVGESGMMGIAVDPDFATNRIVHVCQTFSSDGTLDVRLYRWQVSADWSSAARVGGPTVSGMPVTSSGRHAGCRPRFGPDGMLLIGTGDGAQTGTSQSTSSLGGKVLRVVPGTGAPAPGNPFGNPVYTFGHRNVQGIAVRPTDGAVLVGEHGPDRDDEINRLQAGGNYGWAPGPGYDESVPMTDTARFPDAVVAAWSSGAPTIALSGLDFLRGDAWGAWEGHLVGAALKSSHLRRFVLDSDGRRVLAHESILSGFGRLRTPRLGPDGNLYVTTSNGSGDDHILRVTPR